MLWANPLRWHLSAGHEADITHAPTLLDNLPAQTVIADKGYDADSLVEWLRQRHIGVVIPPRCHRKTPRSYDQWRYRARNLVERFFLHLKSFRRIATRYEQLQHTFNAFITIAACIK